MQANSSKASVEPVSSDAPSSLRTLRARSIGPGGGHHTAPAARSGSTRLAVLRQSAWFPVLARSAAILAGMIALAAIGAHSTLAGSGVSVALPSAQAAPSVSGVWMPPDPTATAATAKTASASSSEPPAPPSPTGGVTADGKVILNVASADELTKLPRVGAKRAQAIIELRRKIGKFKRATELLRVRGIGQKTLKQMLPLLVLDPPLGSATSSTAPAAESGEPSGHK